MSRKDELRAALGPWAAVPDGSDYEAVSDEQWAQWLKDARHITHWAQHWFKIGIARAINELKAKNADGTPEWPSRDALIAHLSKIDEPY